MDAAMAFAAEAADAVLDLDAAMRTTDEEIMEWLTNYLVWCKNGRFAKSLLTNTTQVQ